MNRLIICLAVKLKLRHNFFQFIHRFNIGIFLPRFSQFTNFWSFECCSSWTFKFFQICEKDGKLGFLNISLQSWTKGWRQIRKIRQNRFFYGMFYSWFFTIFYQKTSIFGFWVDGWVLAIKSKHFRDFLEIS